MRKQVFGLLMALILLLSLLPGALADEITLVDEAAEPIVNLLDPATGEDLGELVLSASVEGVLLRWEAEPGETQFQLQRRLGDGDWAELAECYETQYLDSAVQMGETYAYRLRALSYGAWTDCRAETSLLYNPFLDVPSSGKTLSYVSWAFNNGVVNGSSGTGFSPDASCTRVQFVMMLWKMNGSPEVGGKNPFSDISGAKTTKAILWALDAGVINSGRQFKPNDSITRVQIVMILWKMAGSPSALVENPFRDVSGAKTTRAVLWAYEQGITKGTSADRFSPDNPCTRVQLVVFLFKYNDLRPVIAAPTLKLEASAKTVTLSWSAVKGATQYYLYVKKDEGSFGRIVLDAETGCTYTGVYGHRYTFKLTPVFGRTPGMSSRELSATLIKTPARPELRSVMQDGRQISLAWYTLSGATDCEIFLRESGSEGWRFVGRADAEAKSFLYSQAVADQHYEVYIQGVNETDLGTARGPASLIESTEPIELSVRPGFFCEDNVRSMKLEWTRPADCEKFYVYAKEYYAGGDFEFLCVTDGTDFVFEAPKYATRYMLRVVRAEEPALRRPVKQSAPTPGDTGSFEQLSYERVLSLPSCEVGDNFLASRIDAISIVGDDLWYIKSAASFRTGPEDGYFPVVLFRVADFRSDNGWKNAQNPEAYVLRDENGNIYRAEHDSSLSFVPEEDCFYIVSCGGYFENGQDLRDCPIVRVSRQGVVLSGVPAEGFNVQTLSTLAYCGLNENGCPMFWARDGKRKTADGERHKFSLGLMVDGVLYCSRTVITEDVFTMSGGKDGLPHCNDIHYEDGRLYHSVFVYDADGVSITKNWIYVIDVWKSVGVDNNMDVVPTVFCASYDLHPENSSETEFELEGLACYRGELYMGVNTAGMEDGLFRVKDYGDQDCGSGK